MKTYRLINSDNEFPVGKILCLGRNYIEHVKEMKAEVSSKPVVFLKPSSAIIHDGENIIIPNFAKELHHEVELVIAIGSGGKNITAKNADDHILGYAVGLDMTLRDVQNEAKIKGLPWTVAKGFDTAAPISDIIEKDKISDPQTLTIMCKVNGEIRQKSSTSNMIFSIQTIIEFLSTIFTLEAGDLIFTGTPEGVGPVKPGDKIEAAIEGYIKISHPVSTS